MIQDISQRTNKELLELQESRKISQENLLELLENATLKINATIQ